MNTTSTEVRRVVPTNEPGLYREQATEAIVYLENVDESLRSASTVNGHVQLSKSEADELIMGLVFEVRRDVARLRELADSIEQRVRAAETDDG